MTTDREPSTAECLPVPHAVQVTSSRRPAGLWYGASLVLYAILFAFWQVTPVPLSVHVASVLLWAVATAPLAYWYREDRGGVPMFELICLAYGVCYGLPLYFAPNGLPITGGYAVLPWDITFESLLLAVIGVGVLAGTYFATRHGLPLRSLPRLDLPFTPRRLATYTRFALVIGLTMPVLNIMNLQLGSQYWAALQVLSGQFDIGMVLLAYKVLSAPAPRREEKTLLYACLIAKSVLSLNTGMLEGALLPWMLFFLVRWHVRRRFPFLLATAIGAFVFIFNPIKMEYRERVWYGDNNAAGFMERIGVWQDLAEDFFSGGMDRETALLRTVERLDLLRKLTYVKLRTPGDVPYFNGETYKYMLFAYIPRVIWPEKPIATQATDLVDFAYEFRSPSDERQDTKIAIGLIAEAFANYGWKGVIIVMALQGVILGLFDKVLNGPGSVGGRAIYLTVMITFLNGIGGSAVIIFGGNLQFIVASTILMRFFTSSVTAAPEPSYS